MKKIFITIFLLFFLLLWWYFLQSFWWNNWVDCVKKEQCNIPIENTCLNNWWQILDKVDYEVCVFEDNKQCEINALESLECPIWWFKITWYENSKEMYCKITWWEVIAWIDKCTKNGEESHLEEYFINTAYENAVKNSHNLPSCSDLPEGTINQCRE